MASTSKGKARKHQEEPCTFLSSLNILQARSNYCIHLIKGTEKGNPLGKDFLVYTRPAKDDQPEKKFPVCLYQGVWHQLKYTNTREDKLIYLSEPFPEVHNYDVEVPKHVTYDAPTSKSETKRDPLDITICNSPALLKEPLAPETPTIPMPFFAIAKSDLSQLTMTTLTQTTTQAAAQASTTASNPPPLTRQELEDLLNIAMGERGGGPPGGGGGATANPPAQLQPIAPAANVKAMGKDPPLFKGQREKANTFMNEVEKYLALNHDVTGFNSPKKKVTLVLTFMQGPEVEEWTRGILQWIQQINDQSNMDNVWCIFCRHFYNWFQNTQSDLMARKDLTMLKMRFPYIDSYISNFEQLVRKALYQLGSHEMNQQFLSRLPRDIAEDTMCYPTPITYQEYSQKALVLRTLFLTASGKHHFS